MSIHRSGFVNIIGNPNVGKSTLMNALVGERFSIITNKPQTTRHRIIAIINEPNYQIVFSDTPGIIDQPGYKMQKAMNSQVFGALEDADILIYMTDVSEERFIHPTLLKKLQSIEVPIYLVINKIDISNQEEVEDLSDWWHERIEFDHTFAISAKEKEGTSGLFNFILNDLKEGPEYFPKDQFTDRPEKFFVSEIIREKILELFHQEIPYSCEVIVSSFKEKESKRGPLVHIQATIVAGRKSQKNILIGKGGSAIKNLGIKSRLSIETFLDKPVHLELHVKVKSKWRDNDQLLKSYGYLN